VAVCAGRPVRINAAGREWPAVALTALESRDHGDACRVVDFFVDTFGSSGRFAAMIAVLDSGRDVPAGFESASRPCPNALFRDRPNAAPPSRLLYRADPARDWEPRLDDLWRRVRRSYPLAVVRDASHALRSFAAHPTIRHHRFLVCPRFSGSAVAFAVFAIDGDCCRWVDLLWDHDHPGALELAMRLSCRLARQTGSSAEVARLAGDDDARYLLTKRGFRASEDPAPPVVAARSMDSDFPLSAFVEGAYITACDVWRPMS
jgi:hypothetical protein